MMLEFDITDLGILHDLLGLEVYQGDHGIFISQKKYLLDMLKKFNMLNCKTISTPITQVKNCVLMMGHRRYMNSSLEE